MTPGEASKAGHILSIDHPHGGRRYAAHVFDLPSGGIAWAEAGWSSMNFDGHAWHMLHGEIGDPIPEWGWLLITQDGYDVAIDIADVDEAPDGERERARAGITRDLGVTLAK